MTPKSETKNSTCPEPVEGLPFLGHEETYARLETLLASGHLPHALLFSGPEGIGKRLVAFHLAKALFCHNPPGPCGNCPSCNLAEPQNHPDLFVLQPDGGRIKIDSIREITKTLSYPPLMGKTRVILVVDAHTMNNAAANALLKTLEEPPPNTFFILITHSLGWVPRTIVSRCQKILFSPLSYSLLKNILTSIPSPLRGEGAQRADEGPQKEMISDKILRWAQGSVLRAQQLMEIRWQYDSTLTFDEAYELGQEVVEEEKLLPFLESLLCETHQRLIEQKEHPDLNFDLLVFADRILEIRRSLRQNANPKIHLTRLLMFFQEPRESRL